MSEGCDTLYRMSSDQIPNEGLRFSPTLKFQLERLERIAAEQELLDAWTWLTQALVRNKYAEQKAEGRREPSVPVPPETPEELLARIGRAGTAFKCHWCEKVEAGRPPALFRLVVYMEIGGGIGDKNICSDCADSITAFWHARRPR